MSTNVRADTTPIRGRWSSRSTGLASHFCVILVDPTGKPFWDAHLFCWRRWACLVEGIAEAVSEAVSDGFSEYAHASMRDDVRAGRGGRGIIS
jgi:hypothetical protein